MINVLGYSGNAIQQYYIAVTAPSTCMLMLDGPFVWDHVRDAAAVANNCGTIDYGPPEIIDARDWLEQIIQPKSKCIHGGNSVTHRNVTGTVHLSTGQIVTGTRYNFLPVYGEEGKSDQGYWFNPSFMPPSACVRCSPTVDDQVVVGYHWGTSNEATCDSLRRLDGQYELNTSARWYPCDSRDHYLYDDNGGYDRITSPPGIYIGAQWYEEGTIPDEHYIHTVKNEIVDISYTDWIIKVRSIETIESDYHPFEVKISYHSRYISRIAVTPCAYSEMIYNYHWMKPMFDIGFNYMQHCDISDGMLAQDALSGINYINSNTLENASGWLNLRENLPPIGIIKNPLNPKNLAKLYLWYKYSYLPNCHDVPELQKGLRQFMEHWNNKGGYKTKYSTYYAHALTPLGRKETRGNCRVVFRPQCYTAVQELNGQLRSLGLNPSFENLWDLIPFSFVVDWFLPIGSNLGIASYNIDRVTNQYDIRDVILSRKTTMTINAGILSNCCSGSLSYSMYDRKITEELPPNDLVYGRSKPSNHMLEGSALVIANW